jgi:hypothetical protein
MMLQFCDPTISTRTRTCERVGVWGECSSTGGVQNRGRHPAAQRGGDRPRQSAGASAAGRRGRSHGTVRTYVGKSQSECAHAPHGLRRHEGGTHSGGAGDRDLRSVLPASGREISRSTTPRPPPTQSLCRCCSPSLPTWRPPCCVSTRNRRTHCR